MHPRALKRLAAAAVCALGLNAGAASAVSSGDVLPALDLKALGGGEVLTAGSVAGKVTLLNFWATWCDACKVEIKEMEAKLRETMAHGDFRLAFVSLDKDPEQAVAWFRANLKEPEVFLQHLYSDASFQTSERLNVDSFPMTVVVDRAGKVAQVQRGFKEGEGSTDGLAKLAGDLLRAK
jgi:thiol-disulfide isomerase/thioredoxin